MKGKSGVNHPAWSLRSALRGDGKCPDDSLNVVMDVIRSENRPGGGAPEILVAENLRQYASTLEGREQLAIRAFAEGGGHSLDSG